MNYEQRLSALRQLKSSISRSSIEDSVSSFDGDVANWVGGYSKGKYLNYIELIRQDSEAMVSQKSSFEAKIEARIQSVQRQYDSEYNSNKWYFSTQQDPEPIQDRQLKTSYLNRLNVDESVRKKLRLNFL